MKNYNKTGYNKYQTGGMRAKRISVSAGKERSNRATPKGTVVKGAENRLKGFRKASLLAVALTGFILLIFSSEDTYSLTGQNPGYQQDSVEVAAGVDTVSTEGGTGQATDEAIGALQNMWNNFVSNYPKLLIMKINAELQKAEYKNIIIPVYPRQQVQMLNVEGVPIDIGQKSQE